LLTRKLSVDQKNKTDENFLYDPTIPMRITIDCTQDFYSFTLTYEQRLDTQTIERSEVLHNPNLKHNTKTGKNIKLSKTRKQKNEILLYARPGSVQNNCDQLDLSTYLKYWRTARAGTANVSYSSTCSSRGHNNRIIQVNVFLPSIYALFSG
jgi:hypothetical protein